MKQFIDLEPFLGSCDHIWNDYVFELSNYPLKIEQVFVMRNDQHATQRELRRSFIDHGRKKSATIPREWTDDWNNAVKDSRITLVEQVNGPDHSYLDGTILDSHIEHFPGTWAFVKTLPIKKYFRVIFANGLPGHELSPHYDWNNSPDPCLTEKMHMLFINPLNNRPLYWKEGERKIFTNSSLFLFNNAALCHGVLAEQHHTSLLRLYCALDDDFCDKIGIYKVK